MSVPTDVAIICKYSAGMKIMGMVAMLFFAGGMGFVVFLGVGGIYVVAEVVLPITIPMFMLCMAGAISYAWGVLIKNRPVLAFDDAGVSVMVIPGRLVFVPWQDVLRVERISAINRKISFEVREASLPGNYIERALMKMAKSSSGFHLSVPLQQIQKRDRKSCLKLLQFYCNKRDVSTQGPGKVGWWGVDLGKFVVGCLAWRVGRVGLVGCDWSFSQDRSSPKALPVDVIFSHVLGECSPTC